MCYRIRAGDSSRKNPPVLKDSSTSLPLSAAEIINPSIAEKLVSVAWGEKFSFSISIGLLLQKNY
jgi:hypothetical protein